MVVRAGKRELGEVVIHTEVGWDGVGGVTARGERAARVTGDVQASGLKPWGT